MAISEEEAARKRLGATKFVCHKAGAWKASPFLETLVRSCALLKKLGRPWTDVDAQRSSRVELRFDVNSRGLVRWIGVPLDSDAVASLTRMRIIVPEPEARRFLVMPFGAGVKDPELVEQGTLGVALLKNSEGDLRFGQVVGAATKPQLDALLVGPGVADKPASKYLRFQAAVSGSSTEVQEYVISVWDFAPLSKRSETPHLVLKLSPAEGKAGRSKFREGSLSASLQKISQGPCKRHASVSAHLDDLAEALVNGDEDESKKLMKLLRYAAKNLPDRDGCSAAVNDALRAASAKLCRATAAGLAKQESSKKVILSAPAFQAANAIVSEILLESEDGGSDADKSSPWRKQMEHCAYTLAETQDEKEQIEAVLQRLRQEEGGAELPTETIEMLKSVCQGLPQTGLLEKTLSEAPPKTKDDWDVLLGMIPQTHDASHKRVLRCRDALRHAFKQVSAERCRATLAQALSSLAESDEDGGKAQPGEGRARQARRGRGSAEDLAHQLVYEIRRQQKRAPAEIPKLWQDSGVRRCLRATLPDLFKKLVEDMGDQDDEIKAGAASGKALNEAKLLEDFKLAMKQVVTSCEAVLLRQENDMITRLKNSKDLQELDASTNDLERKLQNLRLQLEAEAFHKSSTDLPTKDRDLRRCQEATEDASRTRESGLCLSKLLKASPLKIKAPVSASELELLIRKLVVEDHSRDPELLRCARVMNRPLTNALLHKRHIDDVSDTASSAELGEEELALHNNVCLSFQGLGGPPTNPANPVTLLALAALPNWSPYLLKWLRDVVLVDSAKTPRYLLSPNSESVSSSSDGAFPSHAPDISTLKTAVHELLDKSWQLRELAMKPCPSNKHSWANPWSLLSQLVFERVNDKLVRELARVQNDILEAGVEAAEAASGAAPVSSRTTVYQAMWEAFLRFILLNPKSTLYTEAMKLKSGLLNRKAQWLDSSAYTPSASELVKLEALFFLVLFDPLWITQSPGKAKMPGRLGNLYNFFGLWERGHNLQLLVRASRVALRQGQEWYSRMNPDPLLYLNASTRAQVWRNKDFRAQLLQKVKHLFLPSKFISADQRRGSFLPAPLIFPLIPFSTPK